MRLPENMDSGWAGIGLNDAAPLIVANTGGGQRALAMLALFAPGLPWSGA